MLAIYQKRNASDAMIAICVCHYFYGTLWNISLALWNKGTLLVVFLFSNSFSYFSKTSKQDSLYLTFLENGKQYKQLTIAELLRLGIECMHPITAIL